MQHPCTESLPPPILCMRGSWVRLAHIPRSSEEQLSRAYRLLIAQLTQEHAEIRLSAFQIVDELFARSHQFRMLVVSNFQEFLELTLGTDPAQPLPPPREAAQRLRQAATRAVEGWNEKFGEAYKKLALGYHFLRHNKKVGGPGPFSQRLWLPDMRKADCTRVKMHFLSDLARQGPAWPCLSTPATRPSVECGKVDSSWGQDLPERGGAALRGRA